MLVVNEKHAGKARAAFALENLSAEAPVTVVTLVFVADSRKSVQLRNRTLSLEGIYVALTLAVMLLIAYTMLYMNGYKLM
ncbi:hypothetical protein KSX_81790 [Ktedonospora formicarum]|uniref:Uncharacterized protein n=1 Tax=Ktedonospora formicarum TaxID=2778364 RepID=A0A8J3I7E8_9CHLR|nr:hypothetical protein KSX_81790 [Ktedonospora formicarum]